MKTLKRRQVKYFQLNNIQNNNINNNKASTINMFKGYFLTKHGPCSVLVLFLSLLSSSLLVSSMYQPQLIKPNSEQQAQGSSSSSSSSSPPPPTPPSSGQIQNYEMLPRPEAVSQNETDSKDSSRHHSNHNESNSDNKKLDNDKIFLDLSHPLDDQTLHWPGLQPFEYQVNKDGHVEANNITGKPFYLKQDAFKMDTHCGTHIDAPRHFYEEGWTIDQIPLARLINVPVSLIDLSAKVAQKRDYVFTKEDLFDSVSGKPLAKEKSVVLIYTGVSQSYSKGKDAYYGLDDGSKIENSSSLKNNIALKIPGLGEEAAKYLVEREVYGVGIDALSIDSSANLNPNITMNPVAHVILNSNNIYILENLSNKLADAIKIKQQNPSKQLKLTALPLPIKYGSGSPARVAIYVSNPAADYLLNSSTGSFVPSTNFWFIILTLALTALVAGFNRREPL